jgi:hypothetical protein
MPATVNGVDNLASFANQTVAGGWHLARHTYSFAVDGGTAGTFTQFVVSGTVFVQVFGVCQTLLTADGAATIEVGIVGNTAALIAQTTATDLDQYETWQDATPEANPGPVDLTARSFVITNGADIGMKVATANLTAGVVDFYCLWAPLSADGLVVAA